MFQFFILRFALVACTGKEAAEKAAKEDPKPSRIDGSVLGLEARCR